jgi:hypothetical protein
MATQHSLPSGRYSLLGPDIHWLDRTSLRLAHLFDHFVSDCQQRFRDGKIKRFGGLEVKDKLEFRCLLHRQVGRLLTLENAANVDAGVSGCRVSARIPKTSES